LVACASRRGPDKQTLLLELVLVYLAVHWPEQSLGPNAARLEAWPALLLVLLLAVFLVGSQAGSGPEIEATRTGVPDSPIHAFCSFSRFEACGFLNSDTVTSRDIIGKLFRAGSMRSIGFFNSCSLGLKT
jgi:hypothetical protein